MIGITFSKSQGRKLQALQSMVHLNKVSCTGEGYILSVLNNLALESTWNLIYFIIIKKNNNDTNTCKVTVGSLVSEVHVLGIQKELLHQPVTS